MKQATRELSRGLPLAFSLAPPALTLGADEIHIWWANLDLPVSQFDRLAQTLSTDERKRGAKFHFEENRRHYIATHGILRSILGFYLKIEPNSLQFYYGKNGKPFLSDMFGSRPISFNLSHSDEVALFAFTRSREIGVDVEWVRDIPGMDDIAKEFFSVRENQMFCSLGEKRKKEIFFNLWTRKEAFSKATGDGLSQPLDEVEVSLAGGEAAGLIRIEGAAKRPSDWFVQDLCPASGVAAAFAVEGEGCRPQCWQWLS